MSSEESNVRNNSKSDAGEDIPDAADVARRPDPDVSKELFVAVTTELVKQKKIFTPRGRQIFSQIYITPEAETGVPEPESGQGVQEGIMPSNPKVVTSIVSDKANLDASATGLHSINATSCGKVTSSSTCRTPSRGRTYTGRNISLTRASPSSATLPSATGRGANYLSREASSLPREASSLATGTISLARATSSSVNRVTSTRGVPAARRTPATENLDDDYWNSNYDPLTLSKKSINVLAPTPATDNNDSISSISDHHSLHMSSESINALAEEYDVITGLKQSPRKVAAGDTPINQNAHDPRTSPPLDEEPKRVVKANLFKRPDNLDYRDLTVAEINHFKDAIRNNWSPAIKVQTTNGGEGMDHVTTITASKELVPGEFVSYFKGRALRSKPAVDVPGIIYLDNNKHGYNYFVPNTNWSSNLIPKKSADEANCSIYSLKLGQKSGTIFCIFARTTITEGSILSWCD